MFDARLEPLQNKHEYSDYAREGEVVYMRNKSTLAWAYVRAHPDDFLRLSATRVVCFWTGAGSELNSGIVELHALLTSLLGLLGLAALWRRSRARPCFFCCRFSFSHCRTTSRILISVFGFCWIPC